MVGAHRIHASWYACPSELVRFGICMAAQDTVKESVVSLSHSTSTNARTQGHHREELTVPSQRYDLAHTTCAKTRSPEHRIAQPPQPCPTHAAGQPHRMCSTRTHAQVHVLWHKEWGIAFNPSCALTKKAH